MKRRCMTLSGKRRYDPADIPDDFTVKISKKMTLDDEILKLIWMIKKRKKGLRGEKPVIKASLRYYLDHIED